MAPHPSEISLLLVDRFGRGHDYLRISLVDRCNLRCTYCMPENIRFLPPGRLMAVDEILGIAQVFVEAGVRKIRLTGGEPLVRRDAAAIVRALGRLPVELAITTNGIFLHEFLDLFAEVGLRSLNVSLDTLDPERFAAITRRDLFSQVMANVDLALLRGFRVKLNMVVLQGVNDTELIDFVEMGRERDLHLRFIEFMPFDGNAWRRESVVTYAEMLRRIGERFHIEQLPDQPSSTSRGHRVAGFKGTFAVISTVSKPFCEGCNRLRLTAEGKLRNCLFAREEMDLLSAYRAGNDIRPLIGASVGSKAEKLGGLPSFDDAGQLQGRLSQRAMVKIGG